MWTGHTVLCDIRLPCVLWAPRWISHCCLKVKSLPTAGVWACLSMGVASCSGEGAERLKSEIRESINIKLECALSPHHPPANHHRVSLVSYKFWGGSWTGGCPSSAGSSFLLQIAKDLSGRFSQRWEAELGLAPAGPLPGAPWPAGPAPLAD